MAVTNCHARVAGRKSSASATLPTKPTIAPGAKPEESFWPTARSRACLVKIGRARQKNWSCSQQNALSGLWSGRVFAGQSEVILNVLLQQGFVGTDSVNGLARFIVGLLRLSTSFFRHQQAGLVLLLFFGLRCGRRQGFFHL